MTHAQARRVDSFYPVVSLLAFLSGSCFGFYYSWRFHREDKLLRTSR